MLNQMSYQRVMLWALDCHLSLRRNANLKKMRSWSLNPKKKATRSCLVEENYEIPSLPETIKELISKWMDEN